MPTNTDLTPQASRSGAPNRPIVYLVNADGDQGSRIDLPTLLAPFWRFRWVVIAVLALTVIAAGWVWTRPPQVMHQIVIRRGIIGAAHFRSQLENIIIPGALNAMDPGWRPVIKISSPILVLASGDDTDSSTATVDLSTVSFKARVGSPESTAKLAGLLRQRIEMLALDSSPIANVENDSKQLVLSQAASRAEHAYSIVSNAEYVDAVRGEIDRDIALTEAGIRRQNAIHASLTERYASLSDRMVLLQGLLDNLLLSMDEDPSTYPGMSQVVADRVTSMRMEKENQIPAERVQLVQSIESSQARVDELEASLKQQRLQAATFNSDMAERQANAQIAIESATAALTKYQAQSAAKLVSQPLSIVEEFDLAKESSRLLKTLVLLLVGGFASLLSAYVLEAIRLARIGVMQG